MDSYNAFASYYDGLMEDARYEERCRYILEAAQRSAIPWAERSTSPAAPAA